MMPGSPFPTRKGLRRRLRTNAYVGGEELHIQFTIVSGINATRSAQSRCFGGKVSEP